MNLIIPVKENGRTIYLSKLNVADRQLANKAVGGNLRAIDMVKKILHREEMNHGAKIEVTPMPAPADEKLPPLPSSLTAEAAARIYREAIRSAETEEK